MIELPEVDLDQQHLHLYGGPCDGYILAWEPEGCEHLDQPHHHFTTEWPDMNPISPLLPVDIRWMGDDFVVLRLMGGTEADYERQPGTARWTHVPD